MMVNLKIQGKRVTPLHYPSRVKPRVLAWCALMWYGRATDV